MLISFEEFGFAHDVAIESSFVSSVYYCLKCDSKNGRVYVKYLEGEADADISSEPIPSDEVVEVYMQVRKFINMINEGDYTKGECERGILTLAIAIAMNKT